MLEPRIDRLLEKTGSRYATVIIAAKRARQINSYFQSVGEGGYEEYVPPMVTVGTRNQVSIALEEIAQGKINFELPRQPKQ